MRAKIENDILNVRHSDPRHIIICPIHNLRVRTITYEANLFLENYRLTWPEIEAYMYDLLEAKQPPCHHYMELYNDDYITFSGLGITQESWYLKDLIQAKVIPSQYQDAILIMIGIGPIDLPRDRMLALLAHLYITTYMKQFKLSSNKVLLIDDILLPNYEEILKNYKVINRRFMVEKCKYFDFHQLQKFINKYKKQ